MSQPPSWVYRSGENSGHHVTTGAVAAIDDPQGIEARVIFVRCPLCR
jgi:hypothetical protein